MHHHVGRIHALMAASIMFTCVYTFHLFCSYKPFKEEGTLFSPYPLDNRSFLIQTPGCSIPKFDPFDDSVQKFYIKISPTFHCSNRKSIFKITESGGLFLLDNELRKQYNALRSHIDCFFYPITRQMNVKKPDDHFIVGKKHPLVFDLPIEDDFILVKCFRGNETFYREILAMTPIKPQVEAECTRKQKSNMKSHHEKLNVIIVGIDSVSKLNFLRYMKKSNQFLVQNLSAFEFHGYNKVADNTYPNLIPFFTGHQRNYYNYKERGSKFFDDAEFVWKKYADIGYRTLYSEDAPKIGTFVLNRRGFNNPPTDYYTRAYALALEGSTMRYNNYCIGSQLEIKVYFDYLKRFVRIMGDRLFFSFMFLARLTHDLLQQAGLADMPSLDLLKDLHERGTLNRSLLIFFSDHGIRFGGIRNTYIGKIEERMPFIFLVLPDWFRNKYPIFTANLKRNERRLTTPYDIHATLLHLLQLNQPQFFTSHGQSLFTEISDRRTCSQANLSPHWCVCHHHSTVSNDDPNVIKAARATVMKLNRILKPYSHLCVTLKLKEVIDARISKPDVEIVKNEMGISDYLLTISVQPSLAIFESTVHLRNKVFTVAEDISRINRYNNQSHCIDSSTTKLYCFCKDMLNGR